MKNIKIKKGFIGHEFWPNVAFVDVGGSEHACIPPQNVSEEEMESVIQSWNDIAILKVTPVLPFKFGYIQDNAFHYLKEDILSENGVFGVRLGNKDIRFFVLPKSLDCTMKLELIGLTKENDPKYKDLPLY